MSEHADQPMGERNQPADEDETSAEKDDVSPGEGDASLAEGDASTGENDASPAAEGDASAQEDDASLAGEDDASPEEADDAAADEDEDDEETLESVTVEITGLSLYTHHGVSDAEREVGQRLVLDLRLELGEAGATATDRIEDTVDYAEVCQLVTLIAQQRSHRTLERLCSTIADRLLADYALDGVWVKAAKPEPPIPLPVDEVSVEVWREPGE